MLPVGLQTHLMLTASRPVNDLVFAISGLHTSLKLTAFRPGLCDDFIVDVYHCCPVPVCRDHKVFEYRVLLVLIKPVLDTT